MELQLGNDDLRQEVPVTTQRLWRLLIISTYSCIVYVLLLLVLLLLLLLLLLYTIII